jgi:choline dehydrogenase-like flavoprotein
LVSPDPLVHPLIEPCYLQHEDDVRTLVEAAKVCDNIFQQKAFAGVRGKFTGAFSGCPFDKAKQPDQFWAWVAEHRAATVYHPVGTCKIGAQADPERVVDEKLRVVGVAGLRVVDASIIPRTPSGNTNAPTIMVGERGADLIIADYARHKARL